MAKGGDPVDARRPRRLSCDRGKSSTYLPALLGRQLGDSMHGKSDSTTAQAREQPGEVLRLTRREEQAPAADGDEIAALRAIVEGTARGTGEVFFQSLVRHLATAIGVEYAFVAEFADKRTRVRTLAYWGKGQIRENVEFDLAGTPCEDVVRGGLCHHPSGVKERFPRRRALVAMAIESYLGVPLLDEMGRCSAISRCLTSGPMPAGAAPAVYFPDLRRSCRRRVRAAASMSDGWRESERRYRDLYEEAPNALRLDYRRRPLDQCQPGRDQDARVPSPTKWSARSGCRLVAETPPGHSERAAKCSASRWPADRHRRVGSSNSAAKTTAAAVWVNIWMSPCLAERQMHTRSIRSGWTSPIACWRSRKRPGSNSRTIYLQEEIKSVHNFDEIIGRSRACTPC